MHNLAINLLQKGYEITGSDDEFYEPSKSNLIANGILPKEKGWFRSKIVNSLDIIRSFESADSRKKVWYKFWLFGWSKNKRI